MNAELEKEHNATYAEFRAIRGENQMLWKIKSHIDSALKNREKENTHLQEKSI